MERYVPPALREAAGERLFERLPRGYARHAIATVLAGLIVYREGPSYLEGAPPRPSPRSRCATCARSARPRRSRPGSLLLALSLSTPASAAAPNIILVFIDDMGWGDFSSFGNTAAQTPAIDSLAREGIRFEQFYVDSPICSPSRVALSTGQYPQRWRISSYLGYRAENARRGMADWLDPSAPMLARSLQRAGYATGHFGKWHMGGQRDVDDAPPITAYGFDVALTNFEGMGPKLLPLTRKPGDTTSEKLWAGAEALGDGYRWVPRHEITAGFVEAAQEFIGAAQRSGKPFYVNLWSDDVHSPFWPSPESWQPNRRARYRVVLEEMDRQIAPLLDQIRRDETLARNTMILICSDNGPARGAGDATPFRGYKTQLYEGGIRSPLIVWGPGLVSRRNAVNRRSVFSTLDLVPTLLDISGAGLPEAELDGAVVTEILLGSSDASRDAPLFFRRPPDRDAYYGRWNLPDLAMRKGRWKLLCEYDGSEPELYDLENDPGETTNLAEQHPQVVSNLTRALLAWHRSLPEDTDPGVLWKIPALVLGALEERFF